MKSIEISLQQHPAFKFYEKFFDLKSVSNHLFFIDEWMELVMSGHRLEQKYSPSDLLFFHQLLVELYEVSFAINTGVTNQDLIATHTAIDENLLHYEAYCHDFETRYLTEEELIQPVLTLNFLHDKTQLAYHKGLLLDWLGRSLEESAVDGQEDLIFPLYRNTKRLIEASWLMYTRLLNASIQTFEPRKTEHFCDTCPNLLPSEVLIHPYFQLIIFFTNSSLNSYRHQLKEWFKTAIAHHQQITKPQNFNYLHDQLIQLLEACYLITEYQIPNQLPYTPGTNIFNHWEALQAEINKSSLLNKQYEILNLADDEMANPSPFLRKLLTLDRIREIRLGLKEWSYTGLPQDNIHLTINGINTFELYEKLLKLIELAFALLVEDAPVPLNNLDDETLSYQ